MTGTPVGDQVRLRQCPDGPLLVRGAASWQTDDGTQHPVDRPVVAVCACEKSRRAPWCDGTHKFLNRTSPTEGER